MTRQTCRMPRRGNEDVAVQPDDEGRHNHLELHEYPRFQRWFWKFQRLAWTALFIGIVAALAGLTGDGGILSMARSQAAGSSVSYSAIMRRSRPDTIQITSAVAKIWLDQRFIATFDIDVISPMPVVQTSLDGGLVLSFAQAGQLHIALRVTPKTVLRQPFSIVIGPDQHELSPMILP